MKKSARKFWCVAIVAVVIAAWLILCRDGREYRRLSIGSSMEPAFHHGDLVVVDYNPSRVLAEGDVAVYFPPGTSVRDDKHVIIHRVIGLPGDTVDVERDRVVVTRGGTKVVYENDMNTEREYFGAEIKRPVGKSYRLGADEFFLRGDNHRNSADSRFRGAVKRGDIVGVVERKAGE